MLQIAFPLTLFHLTHFTPGRLYHDYTYRKSYCEYLNRWYPNSQSLQMFFVKREGNMEP